MSKFGPVWKGSRRADTGGTTSLELGPAAVDATSELGSKHLSRFPMSLSAVRDYYGGFFPTVSWVESLKPVSRRARMNPQLTSLVQSSSGEDRESLAAQVESYLAVEPDRLIGMVPLRNRIAGNARVMPSTRIARCPMGDGETLTWRPDDPDTIWCPAGHRVDPFALYPPIGSIEITGPMEDLQSYPYHDQADGKRIYLNGEYMDSLRVYYLIEAVKSLGLLYQVSGDVACAERAAPILYDFACAVPHWPKTHRGRPGVAEEDRLRPIGEYPVYAGIWYDKYHTGLRHACGLAEGYDLVVNAPVWDSLDARADGGDARAQIENDLFLYTVKDAIRYDIAYPHPDSALSNYIPYQAAGLILFGRGTGMPELVHYAYWKLRQLAEKTLMADSVFPESMSYGAMHIHGIARAAEKGEGYTDPAGFTSEIDGRRFDNLDNERELPQLRRAVETLASMVYPDGNYIQAHDTHHSMRKRRNVTPEETRPAGGTLTPSAPLLYPAFGHGVLARDTQVQAHLHFSGNWGHDHDDMLNLILWAYGEELISDIGYQLTYNGFSKAASGHNLVVVDRHTQDKVSSPGNLIGWHPGGEGVQVVHVSAPDIYAQCHAYSRVLFLVPVGETDHLVLDVFEVAGGSTHEWMAQGNCMNDQNLEVSIPVEPYADSYADDGKVFTPPAHREWEKQLHTQGLNPTDVNPWYGVFRDVQRGEVEGPFHATFRSIDRGLPDVRAHFLEPADGDLYTCTVPSLRKCWSNALQVEDHALVETFRMPKIVLRRDGIDLDSRFVVLWEPNRGTELVDQVRNLAPGVEGLVAIDVQIAEEAGGGAIQIYYAADPSRIHSTDDGIEFQGRYATVIGGPDGTKQLCLYDSVRFRDDDFDVEVSPRPPLPVVDVVGGKEKVVEICLDGTWPDVLEGEPWDLGKSEIVTLSQDGDHLRAIPIQGIHTRGTQTFLQCDQHPGFQYDRESRVLREVLTPYNEIAGLAEVRLASRVQLRLGSAGPDALEVRTTDTVSVNGKRVERNTAV